jgi:hypothetical protein
VRVSAASIASFMNWKLASRIRLITLSVASTVEDRPPVIWRMPVWCAIGTKGVTLLQLIRAPERLHGFDPRRDRWNDHFRLEGATIEPISSVGSATVRLLRLNAPERISERRLLQSLGRYPRK